MFQVLKRHYARYTPEVVEEVCGVPRAQFLQVAEALCRNSGHERTTAFCYAVGWTQHTVGVQYIRTAAIIQLLLGNIGRPGGGILALRGHASIQGSTSIPTLYDLLPGYLAMPHAALHDDFASYVSGPEQGGRRLGPRRRLPGQPAQGVVGRPRHRRQRLLLRPPPPHHRRPLRLPAPRSGMLDGTVKGYFLFGQNPAVGSSNSRMHRLALAELEWLVVRDLVEIESATFWLDGPEIETRRAGHRRRRHRGVPPPGGSPHREGRHLHQHPSACSNGTTRRWSRRATAGPTCWSAYHLARIIRSKLASSDDPHETLPLLQLTWDYPVEGPHEEPSAAAVLQEVNGFGADGPCPGRLNWPPTAPRRAGAGSSAAARHGVNQTARRKPGSEQDSVAAEWAWAWPANRRMLYNRASADPEGAPWSERKKYLWWDEAAGKWAGPDVPDFPLDTRPDFRPPDGAGGLAAIAGTDPFIMQGDGRGWLFAPTGLVDGPLPTHYEPHESPDRQPSVRPAVGTRPARRSAAGATGPTPPPASRGPTSCPTSSPPTASPSTTPRAG